MSARPTALRGPLPLGRVPLRMGLIGAGLLILALLPLINPPRYLVTVITEVLIYAIFAMSLDLLLGFTGLASLGHAAFWGLGAYTAAIVSERIMGGALASVSGLVMVPAGILVAIFGALLIGVLVIRTSGVYFLMLTLALSQIVYAAAFKWTWLTGGSNGLVVPRPLVPGLDLGEGPTLYYLALVAFTFSLWALWRVVQSPLGRTFVGIRENESRMRALGYDVWRYKLASFVIAGAFAGFAGTLYVFYSGFVSPVDVYWTTSGLVMIMVIIGGTGTLIGPALGAALELVLRNLVSSLPGIGDRWQLIMGAVFVGFVLFARQGIVGIFNDLLRATRARNERTPGDLSPPASDAPPAAPASSPVREQEVVSATARPVRRVREKRPEGRP